MRHILSKFTSLYVPPLVYSADIFFLLNFSKVFIKSTRHLFIIILVLLYFCKRLVLWCDKMISGLIRFVGFYGISTFVG